MIKLFLVILTLLSSAHAKTYSVAFPNNSFYPQYEQGSEQSAKGFLPELLNKFAKDNNIEFKYRFLPIKRYMEYLKSGEIDFVMPDNPSWAPEHKKELSVKYSHEIMKSRVGVIVRQENKDIQKSDLRTLGTVSGYTVHQFEDEVSQKQLSIKYNISPEALLKQVALNRVQGAYFHIDIALHLSKKLKKNLVLAKNFPTIDYSYHLSTVKHEEVIIALNKWMKTNETWLKKTRAEYLSNSGFRPQAMNLLTLRD